MNNWYLQTIAANEARSEMGLVVSGASRDAIISGEVEGPFCAYSTTLRAKYQWLPTTLSQSPENVRALRVSVEESCLWEPAHPFLYQGQWRDGSSDTTHSVRFGWRVLARRGNSIVLNGLPYVFHGIALPRVDEETLRSLHQAGCNLLFTGDGQQIALTDEFGPFVLAELSGDPSADSKQIRAAGPANPSIAGWIVPEPTAESVEALRRCDKTCLFVQWSEAGRVLSNSSVDLALVRFGTKTPTPQTIDIPWIAVVEADTFAPDDLDGFNIDDWIATKEQLSAQTADLPGCVGWIVIGVA